MTMSSVAQFGALLKKNAKAVAPMTVNNFTNVDLPIVGQQSARTLVSNKSIIDDPVTATTRYDVQSNGSATHRCYSYPDGTIGSTATWSTQDANWTDRGAGYNYFDGTAWGPQPTSRVETTRTGWPEYRPFGPTGELIISHQAAGPLIMNTRPVKGTGLWTQTTLPVLPVGMYGTLWPRVVTNGINHTNIHIIALTTPTGSNGTVYNGMNGALVYCHSLDGGVTWSDWIQPAGLDSANYAQFNSDTYCWAEPRWNVLAFTIGSGFYDQLLVKSTDNGTTWTKTVIWHSLYNLGGSSPTYFNAPDGSCAIALDNQGMAYVVFGLTCDSGTNTSWYYNIFAQGIVYWNEYQPELRQDLDPDSLLANGNLAGWVKDTNVFSLPATQITYWGKSLTSFPALVIDNNCKIFLIFAGACSLLDANSFNLRHIYGRDGCISSGEVFWHNDTLVDITGDWIQYNFAECMYPSASPTMGSGGNVDILFQRDDYAGSYVLSTLATGTWQGQSTPDDNFMTLIRWMPYSWWVCYNCLTSIPEKQETSTLSVSQNVPNPFNGLTEVKVYHQNSGYISLKVTNITGQPIMTMEKTNVRPGVSKFVIDGSRFQPGVYFYTVMQGDQRITKKMIIQ